MSIAFDGLDNRKEVYYLFEQMGKRLPEPMAMVERARFLESLIPQSVSCWATKPLRVDPCTASDAYHLFCAITLVLDVPIETAAKRLERYIANGGCFTLRCSG